MLIAGLTETPLLLSQIQRHFLAACSSFPPPRSPLQAFLLAFPASLGPLALTLHVMRDIVRPCHWQRTTFTVGSQKQGVPYCVYLRWQGAASSLCVGSAGDLFCPVFISISHHCVAELGKRGVIFGVLCLQRMVIQAQFLFWAISLWGKN